MSDHNSDASTTAQTHPRGSALEVAAVMGRLGFIAFGGPVAHLAHFQRELVDRRRWLRDEEFADLIAFCQFLPGPASSQVGMGMGMLRAGVPGMLAAWLCFTMPSVLLLWAAAAGLGSLPADQLGWLHGLLAGVVAIVAQAVFKMAKKLCPSPAHLSLAFACGCLMLLLPGTLTQLAVIALGCAAGLWVLRGPEPGTAEATRPHVGRGTAVFGWLLLVGGVLLPIAWSSTLAGAPGHRPGLQELSPLDVYAAFAQTGTLVFGGGHVVLPMLQAEVVQPGWLDDTQFLAGYGVTQAMPGPIFTLSSYLGAAIGSNIGPGALNFFVYSLAALFGIFVPSFGFVAALLPLWHRVRDQPRARQALGGINAAVVGLLIAALYDPVWTKATAGAHPNLAVAVALASWLLLDTWKKPAWLVMGFAALAGGLLGL